MAKVRTSCTHRCLGTCTDERHEKRYIVKWRDGAQVQHMKTFEKKSDADAHRDKVAPEARQRVTPTVPASSSVTQYAEYWKRLIGPTVKPRTLARYREILALHVLP